ncbi:hypothetical protein BJX63DRAFT_405743 [Aspergillus granulosus]|uniref:DUF6590 domain-containing protein n=1 Tax=Aspergillus granulosus TaxID=176169 RepID=A0ABR4H1Q8_9EURO
MAPRHYSRTLPAHGMNELREDESQYQQYGQYAQGQQFQPSHPNRRDQPLPAHGMNERHEDEGRYQQYGQYAQGQQFQPSHPNRRDQYRERVIRYENYQGSNDGDDEHDDYGEPDDLQNMSGHIRTQLAHPRRVSTQGELDPRYVLQNPEYFEQGKVFSILWHENEGLAGRRGDTHVSVGPSFRGRYNEPIYSTIRRMVVLRAFDRYSWCFSISTYGGRGLAKPGVDPSKHTIVYMRDTQPTRSSRERGIVKEPLMVEPERLDESLDSMSRLNFGKIYTVEHNVKVLPIGKIADELMPKFMSYARAELAI